MDMMFGEGPILSGHWYNPSTGDSFTVKDTYFEDNNLYVITTDGRRMNYDMISKYVQSDKPIPKQTQPAQNQNNVLPPELASQILNPTNTVSSDSNNYEFGILEDDMALISSQVNKEKAITRDKFNINAVQQLQQEDEDSMLIRRILSRSQEPKITCSVEWSKFPNKQLEMLEMMGVDLNKIADYYINKIDLQVIKDKIKEDISKYIQDVLEIETEDVKDTNSDLSTETKTTETKQPVNKKKSKKIK
jgi:3-methyladenine DNA glycosylase AlkC